MNYPQKSGASFPMASAALLALAALALAVQAIRAMTAGQLLLPFMPPVDFLTQTSKFHSLVSLLFASAAACAYAALHFFRQWKASRGN